MYSGLVEARVNTACYGHLNLRRAGGLEQACWLSCPQAHKNEKIESHTLEFCRESMFRDIFDLSLVVFNIFWDGKSPLGK